MRKSELIRYRRLISQIKLPENRVVPTQANLRWIMANAWIENGQNPVLNGLIQLIRPHA